MGSTPDPQTAPAYQQVRRQGIVDAARALVDEMDLDQVQMRDVAARAGVALGTLYRYFASKDHLFAVVFAQWGTPALKTDWLTHLPPAERFRARLHQTFLSLQRHPNFFKIVTMMGTSEDAEAIKVSDIFGGYLAKAFEADLKALPEPEAQHITQMVWALHQSLISQMIQGRIDLGGVLAVVDGFCDLVKLRIETARSASDAPLTSQA